MMTTYEQGIEKGIDRGRREMALQLLEAKFGPLSPAIRQRVETIAPDELRQIMLEYHKAQSLKELRLPD